MSYLPIQRTKGEQAFGLLKRYGYVYIEGEPRSGKTATALYCVEKSTKINSWLIVTKKRAISGWEKFINPAHKEFIDLGLKHSYDIINYESLHKVTKVYKGVIFDESHRLKALGRPKPTYKEANRVVSLGNAVHIHLSGTPVVETPSHIYYQMQLGKWRPFKEKNFYQWFNNWGKPYSIMLQGRLVKQYDKVKPELLQFISKFVVTMTQEEAGISKKYQAEDVLHFVELHSDTWRMIEEIKRDKVVTFYCKSLKSEVTIPFESTMAERLALHQIEGGTLKLPEGLIDMPLEFILLHKEKIKYIENNLLKGRVGIMAHFKAEQELLKKHFGHRVEVYSSNAHKEGVDLSHLDTFIIYSQDYSGEGFIQRRDRIVNVNKKSKSLVHFLLVRKGISEAIYNATKRKETFNNETYLMWKGDK